MIYREFNKQSIKIENGNAKVKYTYREQYVGAATISYSKSAEVKLLNINLSSIRVGRCDIDDSKELFNSYGDCFIVIMRTFNSAPLVRAKTTNFLYVSADSDDPKQPAKDLPDWKSSKVYIYFSDKETAERVANAFRHAVKLSGGKKEPF